MDSSAIVKLYIDEPDALNTRNASALADRGATSVVAYAEVLATFSRLRRDGHLSQAQLLRIKQSFEDDWSDFLTLEVSEPLAHSAGRLTQNHILSGFDAIHLATALTFREITWDIVNFASGDRQLRNAAIAEGFVVV
jgi:predicted nucleic acid-binding protein